MRTCLAALLGAALLGGPALAQTTQEPDSVAAVQKAVVRVLNFERGNLARLSGARAHFTPAGWKAFMKHLDGWLDDNGAPTYTSSFVPSGDATIVSQGAGALQLTIPGTLKQTQGASSTTYRIVVNVRATGTPPRIDQLKQTICGRSPVPPCQ
jgi:hypothetical protein